MWHRFGGRSLPWGGWITTYKTSSSQDRGKTLMKQLIFVCIAILAASLLIWNRFFSTEDYGEGNIYSVPIRQEGDSLVLESQSLTPVRSEVVSEPEPNVNPKHVRWDDDPERVKQFIEAYYRHVPKAKEDSAALRTAYPERNQRWQAKLDKAIQIMSSTLVFNQFEPGEFDGFIYDSLTGLESSLRLQSTEYAQWKAKGEKVEDLPYLQSMTLEPMYYPPSMVLYKLTGSTDIQFTEKQIEHVSRLRNAMVKEVQAVQAMRWELGVAIGRATKEIELGPLDRVNKEELFPEWQEMHDLQERAIQSYINQLEILAATL
jgi:hypothetical protein